MNKKLEFKMEGMHCAACELLVEKKVSKLNNVKKVDAKLDTQSVYIEVDNNTNEEELKLKINESLKNDGYKISENNISKFNLPSLLKPLIIAIFILATFLLLQKSGLTEVYPSGDINIAFVLFMGFIASISSCMAVVGSLVLSISSQFTKENNNKALIIFHLSRIISFFILGGVIGLIGSAFTLTIQTTLIINIILFIVLLLMGLNLLGIKTASKFMPRMPKQIFKSQLKDSYSINLLTPLLLGAVTFFLPCGFTQSMQIYSLTTGSFIQGALTMLVFAIGTFPVLALISIASVRLSKLTKSTLFFNTAGFIVILFAIYNLYNSLVASGFIKF